MVAGAGTGRAGLDGAAIGLRGHGRAARVTVRPGFSWGWVVRIRDIIRTCLRGVAGVLVVWIELVERGGGGLKKRAGTPGQGPVLE